ncbi:hypothetical protein IHE61_25465 [Streptomyces sp. GKU 257-1]|nr:hypothetical protein [Streptomyces sp. GKU 257-1]
MRPDRRRTTGYIALCSVGALVGTSVVVGSGSAGAVPDLADIGAWLTSSRTGEAAHANGLTGDVDGKVKLPGMGDHPVSISQDGTDGRCCWCWTRRPASSSVSTPRAAHRRAVRALRRGAATGLRRPVRVSGGPPRQGAGATHRPGAHHTPVGAPVDLGRGRWARRWPIRRAPCGCRCPARRGRTVPARQEGAGIEGGAGRAGAARPQGRC